MGAIRLLVVALGLTGCSLYFEEEQVRDTYNLTTEIGGRCNVPRGFAGGTVAVWILDHTPSGPGACIIAADPEGRGSWWCLREFATRICSDDGECPRGTFCDDSVPTQEAAFQGMRVCRPPSAEAQLQFSDLPPPCEVANN